MTKALSRSRNIGRVELNQRQGEFEVNACISNWRIPLQFAIVSLCILLVSLTSGGQRADHVTVHGTGRTFPDALKDAIFNCERHSRGADLPVSWRLKEVTGRTSTGFTPSKVDVALEVK